MYHFLHSSDCWELCLASHHLTTTVNTLWVLSHYSNNWAAVLYVFLCRMDGRRDWLTCSLWLILSQEPVSHDTLTIHTHTHHIQLRPRSLVVYSWQHHCKTTHSLHVLQWCCQLYTTSDRGRNCIWWVCVCMVSVSWLTGSWDKINHKLHVSQSLLPSILHKNTYNTAAQLLE